MAAPYNPPEKGEDFLCHIVVQDMNVPGVFLSGVTPATGEFKITVDDGSTYDAVNLATASGGGASYCRQHPNNPLLLELYINSTHMNGDVITVTGQDSSDPKEWADFVLTLVTTQTA